MAEWERMQGSQRMLIIGNSGAGKTWLGRRLSEALSLPLCSMDQLVWEPGGFSRKQPEARIARSIDGILDSSRWIVEGVFGDIAERLVSSAELLIWLDLSREECLRNLNSRGPQEENFLDRSEAAASFAELLAWAEKYWERDGKASYAFHSVLFASCRGQRALRLAARSEVLAFLERMGRGV